MALFKRKNNPTISEIESYYEQQNRRSTSTGRAWVMAILAIIFTVVVLALLFFGGRWLYNTIVDNDAAETTQEDVNSGTVDIDGFEGEVSGTEDENVSSADGNANTGSEGQVSDEAASTNESNVDRIAGSNTDENNDEETSSSVAGPATNIPNTGAGETALFISAIAGIIATTATYRRQLIKKQ